MHMILFDFHRVMCRTVKVAAGKRAMAARKAKERHRKKLAEKKADSVAQTAAPKPQNGFHTPIGFSMPTVGNGVS